MKEGYDAYCWYATHGKEMQKYEGKWVAIVPGRVVASADSLKELMQFPEVKSVRYTALFTKVPREDESIIALTTN